MIELVDVACGYSEGVVLRGVSLRIERGERVALLGPNGGGKTTLLKTIARLIDPIAGSIHIDASDASKLSEVEVARIVAMVFQSSEPAFDFTVRSVVAFGRHPWDGDNWMESRPEYDPAVESALVRLGISEIAEIPVTQLSGGELQRVLVAKALAQQAPLLLLDEPTSHQDPSHQLALARLMAELADEGKAVIFAVHDIEWAMHVATRALVLGEGQVVFDGPIGSSELISAMERTYRVGFFPSGQLKWDSSLN